MIDIIPVMRRMVLVAITEQPDVPGPVLVGFILFILNVTQC